MCQTDTGEAFLVYTGAVYTDGFSGIKTRMSYRWHARRAAFASAATGFVWQPEPRTIGSYARGAQLIAGNYLFAGHLVNAPRVLLWDIASPSLAFAEQTHGFVWLDDLASVADPAARSLAQTWVLDWIRRFSKGQSVGWSADLTARRLIGWINHALFLLTQMETHQSQAFFRSLSQQTTYLTRRWHLTTVGLSRIEALVGIIYAGLSLEGMEHHIEPALAALEQECQSQIDQDGGIQTRNPEDLLEVFTLLNWAAMALLENEHTLGPEHISAIERIAPTLRALRHTDGSLARFHDGGRGLEGRLDHALMSSGVRPTIKTQNQGLSMGYTRLSAGRTSLIVDTAKPSQGAASSNAHASTLAFEMTSGRRPLIVSCGSGAHFGPEWHKVGRATQSHSVVGLAGDSSSQIEPVSSGTKFARFLLSKTPNKVPVEPLNTPETTGVVSAHDGYLRSHGVTHMRQIELSTDGRKVFGEENLAAVSKADQAKFDQMLDGTILQGIPFKVHFHLHPDVEVAIDMGGAATSLTLRSGEVWVFRFEGFANMTLEDSIFLEKTRLKPRKSKQVVLSGVAMDYATRIRWSLMKAHETPTVIRDLEKSDMAVLPN